MSKINEDLLPLTNVAGVMTSFADVETPQTNDQDKITMLVIKADINNLLRKLSNNPELTDQVAEEVVERLKEFRNQTTIVRFVEDIILDKCVRFSRLRCTGAQLCYYLSQSIVSDREVKVFRLSLLFRCLEEFRDMKELAKSQHWLQGFVHFLSELFMHMEAENLHGIGDNNKKYDLNLGSLLCKFLNFFLDSPNNDNLICVGHVLLSTRGSLQEKPEFKKIIDKVKVVICNNEFSNNVRRMLINIVNLVIGY